MPAASQARPLGVFPYATVVCEILAKELCAHTCLSSLVLSVRNLSVCLCICISHRSGRKRSFEPASATAADSKSPKKTKVCTHTRPQIHTHIRKYMYSCMHTYTHACVPCMHTCMHIYTQNAFMNTCIHALTCKIMRPLPCTPPLVRSALFGVHIAAILHPSFLHIDKALLRIYRALLYRCRALLWIYKALVWIYRRAILWTFMAPWTYVLGSCAI